MEIFVDSADVSKIRELYELGLVDGVTTNPTLIKQAGKEHEKVIREICSFVKGPVSVEALGESASDMVREAEEYVRWGRNVIIKIVMTAEGMKAVRELSRKGIKTNVTVVFSPLQALVAAKAGATYVSPFIGRLDDIGHSGMDILSEIIQIYDNYDFKTKVLAASLRHPEHVAEAALRGADAATIPPEIIMKMLKHPLTDAGIKKFLEDAREWVK